MIAFATNCKSYTAIISVITIVDDSRCVESVRIRSFSGPYSVQMWESTGQKNSEYGHVPHSE